MGVTLRVMTVQDYDEVLALWQMSEGIGLSEADEKGNIASFLDRNSGLSYVAYDGETLVAAALCGQDGRRGYIHHLAVRTSHRRKGLGTAIVDRCLSALARAGIAKCHLFVFAQNPTAIAFWNDTRWTKRSELIIMSRYTTTAGTAPSGPST